MSTEQASSLSRVPDERAPASADPGPRGGMLDWMFRTARVAVGPGSRSARAGTLAPLARDTAAAPRSAAYERYLRALRRRTRSIQAWQLGVVVVFLILWEVAPRANWINPMLTSYPSAVARTFMAMLEDGSLAKHTWVTFSETVPVTGVRGVHSPGHCRRPCRSGAHASGALWSALARTASVIPSALIQLILARFVRT